ncbi:MAG: hypothetical protein J6Y77_07290 [Paludibacteraceae bacterium]|nr:hypothetical protein [Paludibacteraceae bacterium]
MITKDAVETAYCFFHQKHRVYVHSQLDWQKEDIEYAIASYADGMNPQLYARLGQGRTDYLRRHECFADDLSDALRQLEALLNAPA